MSVIVAPETEGLGLMLAELVRANLTSYPRRLRHLHKPGTVNIAATDAEVEVGMRLGAGRLHVGAAHGIADLMVAATSETLLLLSNIPLRFGLPDSFTPEGRRVTSLLLKGEIKLRGIPRHVGLLRRLNTLLSVRDV